LEKTKGRRNELKMSGREINRLRKKKKKIAHC
jgi:hypothetical protein